jgi:hypothetical protein
LGIGQQAHLWEPHVAGWQPPASVDGLLGTPEPPEELPEPPEELPAPLDDDVLLVPFGPGPPPDGAPEPLPIELASFAPDELAPPASLAGVALATVAEDGKPVEGDPLHAKTIDAPSTNQFARITDTERLRTIKVDQLAPFGSTFSSLRRKRLVCISRRSP